MRVRNVWRSVCRGLLFPSAFPSTLPSPLPSPLPPSSSCAPCAEPAANPSTFSSGSVRPPSTKFVIMMTIIVASVNDLIVCASVPMKSVMRANDTAPRNPTDCESQTLDEHEGNRHTAEPHNGLRRKVKTLTAAADKIDDERNGKHGKGAPHEAEQLIPRVSRQKSIFALQTYHNPADKAPLDAGPVEVHKSHAQKHKDSGVCHLRQHLCTQNSQTPAIPTQRR